jgi:replication fork clamp-binding protein CrfC
MVQSRELAARFDAYGEWRQRLAQGVSALHDFLKRQELADAQVDQKVQHLLARLHEDKLIVAFVAEFSRGKSELINAIFFADFGERLLPTKAGRTTMCPTELLHDATRPPSIRLLPIETRLKDATVMEFRNFADEWVTFPLDLAMAGRMSEALAKVSEVKRVPVVLARALGLHDDDGAATLPAHDDGAEIEVPCWRHAIINVPHPLLQQGLVILDTPGLNAIGTEPELTLGLLPNAHAVLFVLAADSGVTKTDLEVWNHHLAGDDDAQKAGRLVILNKIDTLWDELKPAAAIDAEIDRQVATTASLLGLPPSQVHAVSAQKALVAKVNGDDGLLARSRVPALEEALGSRLIPAKRGIVGAAAQAEVRSLVGGIRSLLEARQVNIAEQLAELRALRGKNQDVIEHMMQRVREEKELFERGLQRFTALRTVFTQQTNALFDVIGLEALRASAGRTRRSIERSPFTKGVRTAMADFFTSIHRDFDEAARRAGEIHEMMRAMYARFAAEQGTDPFVPPPFSMLKYQKEVDRLERAYNEHFNTLWNMLSKAKFALTRRFFETIASRVKHVYDVANRDVESWLRAVMSPLETQVREHHMQLRRRLQSVERIHNASGELEERIGELEHQDEALTAQVATLVRSVEVIDGIVLQAEVAPAAANAA